MKLSFAPILVVLALLASACGPIRSTVGLIRADKALAEAREMNAGEHAPYPMTLAESLRDKAWEEQGYAQYDTSMNMANEAEKFAREAIQVTRGLVAPLPPAVDDADLFGEEDDIDNWPDEGEASPPEEAPAIEGETPASTEGETPASTEDETPASTDVTTDGEDPS
jgi:hypothetical protein